MSVSFITLLPIWTSYIMIFLIIIMSVWGGMTYSRWRSKRVPDEDGSSINTLVGATLGLLAFILAFTFNLSSSRFDARKHFLLEEVNSIETSFLRAGLIKQPFGSQLKKELLDYSELRIWLASNPEEIKNAILQSQEIQNNIWTLIEDLIRENPGGDEITALFISAINDMFDNQTRRISIGVIDHIPTLIWIALLLLIVIAMFEVGYLLGKPEKSNWVLVLALSLAFSVVIIIIVDLDSQKGNISVNNQILFDMYERISTSYSTAPAKSN